MLFSHCVCIFSVYVFFFFFLFCILLLLLLLFHCFSIFCSSIQNSVRWGALTILKISAGLRNIRKKENIHNTMNNLTIYQILLNGYVLALVHRNFSNNVNIQGWWFVLRIFREGFLYLLMILQRQLVVFFSLSLFFYFPHFFLDPS